MKRYIALAALALPLGAAAQTTINFEDAAAYKALGVYDTWSDSPFRTGKLSGNVKVITNELTQKDDILDIAPNASEKMLALQRSRFGSNTFGARIDLAQPFELTKAVKYVHVMLHKPVAGRVMLIGLGKRKDRTKQSEETEQFWELAKSTITPEKWSDAVFAIKGAGGIDIHSLVVVPDCESPHALAADYAVYIDEIEINDSPLPRVIYGDYPLSFEKNTVSGKTANYLRSVKLAGSADGEQTLTVGSVTPQLIYRDMLPKTFTAKAGERITPTFDFTAGWMNGYVYLDRENDGKFSAQLNDNYTIPEGSDIMTYAYVETVENTEGYKSDGSKVAGNARNLLNPPAFTLPSDLKPGYYRMRFKVDWGNVDPAGRNTASNGIIANGGQIVDVRMNIHGDEIKLSRSGGLNGDLHDEEGNEIVTKTLPFGKPFTIVSAPAPDFELAYVTVRHGYNLAGDSLVHGTPQYVDEKIPATLFRDGKYTLPASMMDGEVILTPQFVNPGVDPNPGAGEYARNFADDLAITRADRKLNDFTLTGTKSGAQKVTLPAGTNYVYRNLTPLTLGAVAGETFTPAINYTGRAMHMYLYVDLNEDGQFSTALNDNGTPAANGEMLSYTYYDGKNSLGEQIAGAAGNVPVNAMPAFTLSELLPVGVYRARLKVDWNNIDPAGQWSADGNNKINDNGGYVVDFLLCVRPEAGGNLEVLTQNGSVYGANNTALPLTTTYGTSLTLVPAPAAAGYESEGVVIRTGVNLDGKQYVHGNQQWSEITVPATAAYTLPADKVTGDVRITANFAPTAAAKYQLVFADEFDTPDGTQPDASKWVRCVRQGATWNRWLSKTEKQHAATAYIADGKLVAHALPNPDKENDDVPMVTGGVQSSGLFAFRYGKIEGRLRTLGHTGNFPAFWMMPADQTDGWPTCGEIDIWEQINAENKGYHTVHSNWTYNLGNKNNPPSSFTSQGEAALYHTVALEWDETSITWFVDGKQVGRYAKSTDQTNLSKGQWPFDKYFYIILNQSVGNGSWAANADQSHTYTTYFDWVRVYQKEGQVNTGLEVAVASDLDVRVQKGVLRVRAQQPTALVLCDLSGRLLDRRTLTGDASYNLGCGIYLVNGKKVLVP